MKFLPQRPASRIALVLALLLAPRVVHFAFLRFISTVVRNETHGR